MGYYIHLYTDYLWFKFFIQSFIEKNKIVKLNNKKIDFEEEKFKKYIYDDYTTLNKKFIEQYNLDFKIFYQEPPELENIIKEIPINKIDIIINQAGLLIKKSIKSNNIIFNENLVNDFIEFSVSDIIANIDNINIKN